MHVVDWCLRGLLIVLALMVGVDAAAAPKAVVEPTKIDLGTIRMGETVEKSFTIRNEGDEPLEVSKIQSSCPCLTITQPDDPNIAPGQSQEFPFVYDSEDKHGERGATIAITTNDPGDPIGIVELGIRVVALVITDPDTALDWGLMPRGYDLRKGITLTCGIKDADMELLDIHMEQPGLTLKTEKVHDEYVRYKVSFSIEPTIPLGKQQNVMVARLKVGEEEVEIKRPVMGIVAGDILVGPPLIFSSIYTTKQGDRISEIYVKSSTGGPPPRVLGALCVGPLRATIEPNYAKNQYTIGVFAADNLSGGARSGTVYVMSESVDEPIVAVPVYFKADRPIILEPAQLVFSLSDGAPPAQTIRFTSDFGKAFSLTDIYFEEDLFTARIVKADSDGKEAATIEVTPTGLSDLARAAASIIVKTNCAGAEELLIPILLKP